MIQLPTDDTAAVCVVLAFLSAVIESSPDPEEAVLAFMAALDTAARKDNE